MIKHILAFSIFLLFSSCSDFNGLYAEDVDINITRTTVIPGQTDAQILLTSLGFNQFSQFDISSSQSFKQRVGDVSKVTFVNLETFTLSTTDPDQSLDFFSRVSFYIAIGDGPEELIAYADDFPLGIKAMRLSVEKNLDLTQYIKSQNITIRAEASGSQPISDTELKADLVFLVDTKLTK